MTRQASRWVDLPGVGQIRLVPIDDDHPRPVSESPFDDWGDHDLEAKPVSLERWLIEVQEPSGVRIPVGDLSAHPVWYGPNLGSKAMNIGISIASDSRGLGIGTLAQRMLAEELHHQGILRVEASTDVVNHPEQRALANAGFHLEGVARMAQQRRDGHHDLQVWSHLSGAGKPRQR